MFNWDMNDVLRTAIDTYSRLSGRGRKTVQAYILSLLLLAGLDGMALLQLARILNLSADGAQALDRKIVYSALSVIALFLLKSIFSVIVSWVSLKELARQEVEIGSENLSALSKTNWENRINLQASDYFSNIDRGPATLIQGFLVSVASLVAEILSGLVILAVVLYLQPITAATALVFFVFVALLQHKILAKTSKKAGQVIHMRGNSVYDSLNDYFNLSKLLTVMPSRTLIGHIDNQREELAHARAQIGFIATIPRYFMESVLALGFLLVAGVTWITDGKSQVVFAVSIFAAAGFRLLPIINRIQGLVLSSLGYLSLSQEALRIWTPSQSDSSFNNESNKSQHTPQSIVKMSGVTYRYPLGQVNVIQDLSLELKQGLQYALVGPSGSGKTTLVDLILGLLTPSSGSIQWNNQEDHKKIRLGYVPQETYLSSSTLKGNIALEWDDAYVNRERVENALTDSQLHFLIAELENAGINEKMRKLSGGQKQRIGLARAMYHDSDFFILDEATSSLDAITENEIMTLVSKMRGTKTVLIVAHRLSTIRHADEIIYIDSGRIRAIGTFDAIRKSLPEFEEQIRLGTLAVIDDEGQTK